MKYNFFILALATLALFSCMGDKVETPSDEGELITIRAYQEGAAETRTTLIDGGTQVYWEPADEVKLFFRGAGSRFLSQNTENSRAADFTGSLNVVVGHNEGASGSNTLWGLYPYRADATSDGESVTTTLPAEQTGRAGSFAKNTHITVAQSSSFDLAFYNVCGGVRFSLTQEGIKRVTFEGNNGEALAGKIKLAFEDGIPTVQEISDTSKVITLSAPNGGTFQTGQWYYIEALPGALSGGYKMVFYKESESAKITSSSSVTFRRGVFGSLADADEDLMFKPTGGGDEPNPDDFILFEDPVAKYACVEKFDTNGDGEISYAEAAAVTRLSGLFTNWNTVRKFDEIRFFTGVTDLVAVFGGLSRLESIIVPDNITILGPSTFQGCSSLRKVVLPISLSSLPSYCFDGCSVLTSVNVPDSLSLIPEGCFRNCRSLQTIELPSSIKTFEKNAFSGCSSLKISDLPPMLETIGDSSFQDCYSLDLPVFPSSLRTIGQSVFANCTSISSVTIDGYIGLGKYSFSGCSSLESIAFPSKWYGEIPPYCFQNCYKLSSVIWPTDLGYIGSGTFSGCDFKDANYSLELPVSITHIASQAFGMIQHLKIPSTSIVGIRSDSFKQCTYLYVPSNMVEMYKVRTYWSNYANMIRPLEDYPFNSTN